MKKEEKRAIEAAMLWHKTESPVEAAWLATWFAHDRRLWKACAALAQAVNGGGSRCGLAGIGASCG